MKFMNNDRWTTTYQDATGGEGSSGGEAVVEKSADTVIADEKPNEVVDPPAEVKPFYQSMPDDWRTQAVLSTGMSKDDEGFEKRVKQLDRVSDFGVMTKNYFEAQDTIRKGLVPQGLPENATEEQIAEYKEGIGVPKTAEEYSLSLDEGLVLGDSDEALMKGVYDIAFEENIPAGALSKITNAVLQGRQQESEALVAQDGLDKQTSDKLLGETWGGELEANKNVVQGLINSLPETVKEGFMNARLQDGKALFNSPEIIVAFAEWGKKINPSATVVPNSNNPMQTINDEISTLEGRMKTDDGWHKDTKSQNRYMELIKAKEQMEK